MRVKEQYVKPSGEFTTIQEYDKDGKAILPPAKEVNGDYIYEVEDLSHSDWLYFLREGHKLKPSDYNESTCVERGIIKAIVASIEYHNSIRISNLTDEQWTCESHEN